MFEDNTVSTGYVTNTYEISDYVGVLKGHVASVADSTHVTLGNPTDSTDITTVHQMVRLNPTPCTLHPQPYYTLLYPTTPHQNLNPKP